MSIDSKILSVTPIHLSIPLVKPVFVSTFQMKYIETCLVRVRTLNGFEGIGWSFAFGAERARALVAMVRDLSGVLIGEDATKLEDNWDCMRKSVSFVGRDGISAMAISSLDTACWDISSKINEMPLWKYLGGKRTRVRCYASEGLWLNYSLQELIEEALLFKNQGFKGMKLRVGKSELQEDIDRISAVRETIGEEINLMVDVNQGWNKQKAFEAIESFNPFNLTWIEEPVDHEDYFLCSEVKRKSSIPICSGETNYNVTGMLRLLSDNCVDFLMPDLQRCSGITGWKKVSEIAQIYSIPITSHLFHEISSHLMSLENEDFWCEYMPWWDCIFEKEYKIFNGEIVLSEVPGIGLKIKEEALVKFSPPVGG